MRHTDLFPESPAPTIYAYSLPGVPSHSGCLKIGYTTRDPHTRIAEHTHTAGLTYRLELALPAVRSDGTLFRDTDVHALLRHSGFLRMLDGTEWFRCTKNDVRRAVDAVRERRHNLTARVNAFTMRPEQAEAVNVTAEYFNTPGSQSKFLWNAKMRFGKTFAAYQLCRRMNFRKIIVVTFKPVVESAWSDDILTHKDFDGWQFISNHSAQIQGLRIDDAFAKRDTSKPVVVFGSFQDLMGRQHGGGIKAKNEFIHATEWDIAVFDEYHFGAWRDNAKGLFKPNDEADIDPDDDAPNDSCSGELLPISARYKLYMSGTPFRALNTGEFIEEQIYSWTYTDEQRAKALWRGANNPYAAMPRMVMMTYQIPESVRRIAMRGEFDAFDLNEFFAAEGGVFKHADEVHKWLMLIRGAYLPFEEESLKLGREDRPPLPYADRRLLKILRHTVWFLPDVASCRAMYEMLCGDEFFREYEAVLCAGDSCGDGLAALEPVRSAIGEDSANTRTITLTCGKLLTGVTVKEWSGIFMLRNLRSPETYFQAAFRVQSPYIVEDSCGERVIMKPECYVFDFALDRALKQAADYSCRLNIDEPDPEKKAEEFMNFLPVLAFDGSSMRELDAGEVLEFALTGTSAVLLARRWQSALLVNLNVETLKRLQDNDRAMDAVKKITAFRALNKDIETIINETESVKKAKPDKKSPADPKDKEERRTLKEIREKLMKFLTRIPLFMYLTDDREKTLRDIILNVSPDLFEEVTGITVADFELLNRLELFNAELINEAIYKFKRYEDSSLNYTGLELNETQTYGLYNETRARDEFYGE